MFLLRRSCRLPSQLLLRQHLAVNHAHPWRSMSTATAQQALRSPLLAQHKQAENIGTPKAVEPIDSVLSEPASFESLEGKVSRQVLSSIKRNPKLTHMTSVQEAVFKYLPEIVQQPNLNEESSEEAANLGPRDLMVRAKTGTGKTLAFLIPAIEHRLNAIAQASKGQQRKSSGGRDDDSFARRNVGALILSPTRELASQIATEAKRLTAPLGFSVHELLGGLPKGAQVRRWRGERRDIVVATTGRLRDLMDSHPDFARSLSTSKMLLLDEADTMLDMGFREDIDAISKELAPAPERQTFVFSATISKAIQQVAQQVMSKNFAYLNCVADEGSPVHDHIPQYHTVLPSATEQINHIVRLLAQDQLTNPGKSKTIIFLPTTKMTQFFSRVLRESKYYLPAGRTTMVHEIHSKLTMNARTRASTAFRNDTKGASILVTSDVSARGVDYPGVTRVIQVGVPSSSEQYIHRVGRTGRTGGVQGRGDLVLLPWEQGYLQANLAEMPLKPVTTDDLKSHVVEIAAKHDEDPTSFFPETSDAKKPEFERERGDRRDRRFSDARPSTPLTRFDRKVEERIKSLEDGRCLAKEAYQIDGDQYFTEVEEVFTSLLGYYSARVNEMRSRKSTVLDGIKTWATEAAGMERPPHVSENFLNKIGFGGADRQPSRFGSRSGSHSSSSYGRSRSADSFSKGRSPYREFEPRRSRSSSGWDTPDFDSGRRQSKYDSPNRWSGRGSSEKKRSEWQRSDRGRQSRDFD